MVDYVKKYQKIVDELIRESFPELKGKRIKIIEFPRMFQVWSFAQRGFENYYIFINKTKRGAKKISLKGQFAHELCHLVLDHVNKSFFGDLFHNLFKKFPSAFLNTKFSRDIEIEIDKEVIKRGYSKELAAQTREWIELFGEDFVESYLYSRGYFSLSQIKEYKERIKK